MARATTTSPACVVLTSAMTCDEVRDHLDKERTSLDVVQQWLEEQRLEVSDIAGAFGDVFDRATMKEIIGAQSAKALAEAEARGIAKGKASGGSTKGITWKVSKRGLVSVYGLNAQYPISMYLPQLVRFMATLADLDRDAFDATTIGKWAAGNPTEVYSVDDYETESEKAWLADAKAGKHAHVIVKGAGVAVSLSLSAPAK